MFYILLIFFSHFGSPGKLGLCCEECNSTHYAPLTNVSSWAYRYSLFIDNPDAARWFYWNKIEFVPHLAHKKVPLPGGSCNFDKAPLCTDSLLDEALAVSESQLQGQKMKYLMGWNEAYDHSNKLAPKKWIPPTQAATWWRLHVQGMAARANLSLVSPTTGVESKKLNWFGDMLLACWNQRNLGCDVETIVAFSVHDYKCGEDYWKENYGVDGIFQRKLTNYITERDESHEKNWREYVQSRPIWVTETNCNGESTTE